VAGEVKEEVKTEMKRKRRKEKMKELVVTLEEEAGGEEEDSSEGIALDMSEGEAQEDLEMKRAPQSPLERKRVEKWRVMTGEEEGAVAADEEDLEPVVVSVAVEDSAELVSVEDTGEDVVDSEETGEDSVVAAGLEDPEEDSVEEGEDLEEAMTEGRAVLNSANNSPSQFSITSSTISSAGIFLFSSSLDILRIANDQSYKSLVC